MTRWNTSITRIEATRKRVRIWTNPDDEIYEDTDNRDETRQQWIDQFLEHIEAFEFNSRKVKAHCKRCDVPVWCIINDDGTITPEQNHPPCPLRLRVRIDPDSCKYVIFNSGV